MNRRQPRPDEGDRRPTERTGLDAATAYGDFPFPAPPAASNIIVERTDAGVRIALPRRLPISDLAGTALAAAAAVWILAGIITAAVHDPAAPLPLLVILGLVALPFAALAGITVRMLAAPRVIEDRGRELQLSRSFRGRRLDRTVIAKSAIEAVCRAGPDGAERVGPVRIRTDRGTFKVGRRLEPAELDWLHRAVRAMTGRG